MNILQVTAFFTPEMGGSAEVPYQLTKKLVERGTISPYIPAITD
jgi:hypothetical protein